MTLHPLPAFNDNYIWVLHDGQRALVVDPGEPGPLLRWLQDRRLRLDTILITHHHADHTGGVAALREATGAQVFGPALERLPEPVQRVAAPATVQALGLAWQVIDVPGHTAGHIAYFCENVGVDDGGTDRVDEGGTEGVAEGVAEGVTEGFDEGVDGRPLLFCGDTLFSAGCGRLFEGTPAQMHGSLGRLAALPAATRVCCTHEYTLSNLRFALAVEPGNADLQRYAARCESLRAGNLPTLPSSIDLEKAINPFLRTQVPEVVASARRHDPQCATDTVGVLATLRTWKNNFT